MLKIWKSNNKHDHNLYCYYDELNALTGNTLVTQEMLEAEPWRELTFGLGLQPGSDKFVCQGDGIEYFYSRFRVTQEFIDNALREVGWQMFKLPGGYYKLGISEDLLATVARQEKTISVYESQLDEAARILDEYLVLRHGEEAAWEYNVGHDIAPDWVTESDHGLWELRERINSTLH